MFYALKQFRHKYNAATDSITNQAYYVMYDYTFVS